MANEIASRDTLVDYVRGEAKLVAYSGSSEDSITDALAAANGEGLAALDRSGRYTDASIAGLAAATAPADLRDAVHARALHHLTKSGGNRPDIIGVAADEASRRLSLIATGNYIVRGITATATSSIHYTLPDSPFDTTDTASGIYYRDRDL